MARYMLMVWSNAEAGRDDEFNAWYDSVHLPEVCEVAGFRAAERFEVVAPEGHRYLATYEIEADSPEEAMANLHASTPGMNMTDALDRAGVKLTMVRSIRERHVGSAG